MGGEEQTGTRRSVRSVRSGPSQSPALHTAPAPILSPRHFPGLSVLGSDDI